jgi:autotransporter-associated beta strand protein
MSILACGAFGNSVQAQEVWLNDTLSGYTTDNVPLTTAASPQLIAAPGSSWTVLGAGSTKKLRTFKPPGAGPTFGSGLNSASSRLAYKLSTDANNATDRPVGYLTYKITPGASMANTFSANGLDGSYMEAGLGPTGMDVPSSAGQLLLWGRFYFNNSTTTPQYKVRFYHLKADYTTQASVTQTVGSAPVTLNAGENTVKIWYNKSNFGVSYTPPGSSSAVTLAANSWVAYVNDTIATGLSNTGVAFLNNSSYTVSPTTSTAVGKFAAFNGSSGHTYDFSLSDIYVADTAPSSGVGITSATTATAQAGYPFSYTIRSSGVTSPVYSTSTLPSGLSVDSSTGVISGTLGANATSTTIGLTANGTGGPATANLALTVTPAPTVVPSFTSTGIASGFLTKTFSYSIQATVNETTPRSIPTSYAIDPTTPLPAGLSLTASTGIIGGIPTATGVTTVTYTATNPFGTSDAQTLTITINPAPVFTWNNTGTAWTNAASWTNNAIPANSAAGDIAAFGNLGSSATSVDVGTGRSIAGIVFNSGAYAYTWTGTDITVGSAGSITNNSSAIQTFGNKVSSSGDGTWSSVLGGSLVFNGGIDLSATGVSRKLTIAGAGNVTVNGVIANGGTSLLGQVYKSGTGTLMLNGTNTYTGATEVVDGTMILSAPNSSTSYKLGGYDIDIFPVLKVSATNALSPSATLAGSSSSSKTGTLEFTTNGNYTLNQYAGNNMNFSNSSGSATTLTFTNATNVLSTGGGRTFANQSANLTITFNGQVDIAGNTNNTCTISAVGPVVISNRVFNSNTNFIRSLEKLGTGNLTMYGVNSYSGTIVARGTLVIPTGGSLVNCGTTVVASTSASAENSASLNLAGAAGVVQVSTNGFVRGGGSITSLEVQDAGAVEVAVGTTWTTGGTIDFAAGSKVLVTGTPTEASYTLVTASGGITGTPALETPIEGYSLDIEGNSLVLKQTSTSDTTPPVITVVGADPVTVAQGSVYSDEGATTDDGSAVTANIPDSITSTVGSKTVTYDSVDASGNNATQRTRTVIVTDQTAPVLVLNGANPLSVTWGGVFTDPGASFTDNVDASKTVYSLDTVDTSRLGSTTLTYSAVDAGGNAAVNVTRAVTVTLADGGTTVGADGLSDLMRYALGGTGPSSKVELPTVAVTSTTLTMNALIRIDDLKVSVVGIYGLAPGTWVTGSPITGVPSSSQTGAVAGVTQRQDFSVPRGTDSKKFMYLKATQTP